MKPLALRVPHHVGWVGSPWAGGEEGGSLGGRGHRVVVGGGVRWGVVVVTLPGPGPHVVTMSSHVTVWSHGVGPAVTSSLHLMSISVSVTVLLHRRHGHLVSHGNDGVVGLMRGACLMRGTSLVRGARLMRWTPLVRWTRLMWRTRLVRGSHARPGHHDASRHGAGWVAGVAVLVHHDVAGRSGVGSMSVSHRGVVRLAGPRKVRVRAPSTGGHSHGDLGHLHVSKASQPGGLR